MAEFGDTYDFVGFIGGVILGTALVPQIYLALRRRSTANISYVWQGVSTVGLCTLMAYYAHHSLWPVFYPMAFKLACLVYLIGLKVYYEEILEKVHDAPNHTPDCGGIASEDDLKKTPPKLSLEALKNDMLNCRSVEAGWTPSKVYLGASSKASRSSSRVGASAASNYLDGGDLMPSKPSTFFKPALSRREKSADSSTPKPPVAAPSFSRSRMGASARSDFDDDNAPSKPSVFFRPYLGRREKSADSSTPKPPVAAPSFGRSRMGASARSDFDDDNAPTSELG